MAVVGHVEWVQFARVRARPAGGRGGARERPVRGAGRGRGRGGGPARPPGRGGDADHRPRRRRAGASARASAWPSSAWRSTRPRSSSRRAVRVTLLDEQRGAHDHHARGAARPAGRARPQRSGVRAALRRDLLHRRGTREALRCARDASRVLTASPRAVHALGHGVQLDALILSNRDELRGRGSRPAWRVRPRPWWGPKAPAGAATGSAGKSLGHWRREPPSGTGGGWLRLRGLVRRRAHVRPGRRHGSCRRRSRWRPAAGPCARPATVPTSGSCAAQDL